MMLGFELTPFFSITSGRKITQDGQRDLDRIAMTLAEESDEE
jgi:ribosomal protein S19E (S16A)